MTTGAKPRPITVEQASLDQEQAEARTTPQLSIFATVPSEIVLAIFSYIDIVSIFRFLDTCRYHRQLLLSLPEVWHRVRLLPVADPNPSSSGSSSAAASLASQKHQQHHLQLQQKQQQLQRQAAGASPSSISNNEAEESRKAQEVNWAFGSGSDNTNKGRHGSEASAARENERDQDRGGSQSPISEVYAVLRRFRKENHLVGRVREIYMDSTDSAHFPSPLVMLIKFPSLRIISSRYRRKMTSLSTDVHTLKDMLRNGVIAPHSLELRHWDIWHPYMTKEDVTGFLRILNELAIVDNEESHDSHNSIAVSAASSPLNSTTSTSTLATTSRTGETPSTSQIRSASKSRAKTRFVSTLHQERKKKSVRTGVTLDIRLCPGPDPKDVLIPEPTLLEATAAATVAAHSGGGMHWGGSGVGAFRPSAVTQPQSSAGVFAHPHPLHLNGGNHLQHQYQHQSPAVNLINYNFRGQPHANIRPMNTSPPTSSNGIYAESQAHHGTGAAGNGPHDGANPDHPNGSNPKTSTTESTCPGQNVIWIHETCPRCDAIQTKCWKCGKTCKTCGINRVPAFVRHQTTLVRKAQAETLLRLERKVSASMANLSGKEAAHELRLKHQQEQLASSSSTSSLSFEQQQQQRRQHQYQQQLEINANIDAARRGDGQGVSVPPAAATTVSRQDLLPEFSFFD